MYDAVVVTLGLVVELISLYFLVGIWKDDRLMRIAAEQSLIAQQEYLGLRRRWYESRTKKKPDVQNNTQEPKTAGGIPDVGDPNDLQHCGSDNQLDLCPVANAPDPSMK